MTFWREWLKRYRAARCGQHKHSEREYPVLDHDRKPTRLILVQCRHCGLNYTRWDSVRVVKPRRAF